MPTPHPWLAAYQTPLDAVNPSELAVELCDDALVRLIPPYQLPEATLAIQALASMARPHDEPLLRLYAFCLAQLAAEPDDETLRAVRSLLASLRAAFLRSR
jgi:hypothetical protein